LAEKKKKGFLSKLGFKSKAEKLAEEAAAKAAAQQRVDEKMAARMAAINAAALASARKQDEAAQGLSEEEIAARELEEKRLAEIQAARDVKPQSAQKKRLPAKLKQNASKLRLRPNGRQKKKSDWKRKPKKPHVLRLSG